MRGKVTHGPLPASQIRITPACAGKSWLPLPPSAGGGGSPPRVRGKEIAPAGYRGYLGITPACAGKRQQFKKYHQTSKDHPRVCGEKYKRREKADIRLRITPACAGKSAEPGQETICTWDHPRVCGEKGNLFRLMKRYQGSPPRVRGKAEIHPLRGGKSGITPACAGKRLKKAHKIKDFDPVPIRFHLVFRRFERWCSNLPTPDGNVPV